MHLTLCTRHFTQKKVYDEIPKQIGALMQKLRDTQVLTTNGEHYQNPSYLICLKKSSQVMQILKTEPRSN